MQVMAQLPDVLIRTSRTLWPETHPIITAARNTPGKVVAVPIATPTNPNAMYIQPRTAVRWLSDNDYTAILDALAAAVSPDEVGFGGW